MLTCILKDYNCYDYLLTIYLTVVDLYVDLEFVHAPLINAYRIANVISMLAFLVILLKSTKTHNKMSSFEQTINIC